jgi:Raf kinase inhibitor-like YbhB/YbcL family protein
MPDLELTSPAFDDGEPIPAKHTDDGEGSSPPLTWNYIPEGTRSIALIVHDPDAHSGDFTHWLAWNIDPDSGGLEEGARLPARARMASADRVTPRPPHPRDTAPTATSTISMPSTPS